MYGSDRFCSHCYKVASKLQKCSGCRKVHYCNQACQKTDWPTHKQVCKITAHAVNYVDKILSQKSGNGFFLYAQIFLTIHKANSIVVLCEKIEAGMVFDFQINTCQVLPNLSEGISLINLRLRIGETTVNTKILINSELVSKAVTKFYNLQDYESLTKFVAIYDEATDNWLL